MNSSKGLSDAILILGSRVDLGKKVVLSEKTRAKLAGRLSGVSTAFVRDQFGQFRTGSKRIRSRKGCLRQSTCFCVFISEFGGKWRSWLGDPAIRDQRLHDHDHRKHDHGPEREMQK